LPILFGCIRNTNVKESINFIDTFTIKRQDGIHKGVTLFVKLNIKDTSLIHLVSNRRRNTPIVTIKGRAYDFIGDSKGITTSELHFRKYGYIALFVTKVFDNFNDSEILILQQATNKNISVQIMDTLNNKKWVLKIKKRS
jgi:hypothetical protein